MTTGTHGTGGTDPTGAVRDAADQPTGTVGTAVEQAKEKAGELVEQAKGQATPRLESQKERAAEGLGNTARALRQTSQQLREQEDGPVAQYAERAADRIERAADYLRGRDINELVGELESFARRQPVLFVGGAFALGLLTGRFLKSSGQRSSRGSDGQAGAPGGYLPAPGQTSGSPYNSTPATDLRTGSIRPPSTLDTDAAGMNAGRRGTPDWSEASSHGASASSLTSAAGLGAGSRAGTDVGGMGASSAPPESRTGYSTDAEQR